MICAWCSKESDRQYHEDCWRNMHEAYNRDQSALVIRTADIIAQIKAGGNPEVPHEVRVAYGKNIDKARELASKRRGGGRSTENI